MANNTIDVPPASWGPEYGTQDIATDETLFAERTRSLSNLALHLGSKHHDRRGRDIDMVGCTKCARTMRRVHDAWCGCDVPQLLHERGDDRAALESAEAAFSDHRKTTGHTFTQDCDECLETLHDLVWQLAINSRAAWFLFHERQGWTWDADHEDWRLEDGQLLGDVSRDQD